MENVIQKEASVYMQTLQNFIAKYKLQNICSGMVDHAAYKCVSSEEFETSLSELKVKANHISVIVMDGRRLATIELVSPLSLGDLGLTYYLELMEPKPERIGTILTPFDHIELYNPNFELVENELQEKGISFTHFANDNHKALVITINSLNQQLKFTDSHLREISKKEVSEKRAKILK